MANVVKNDGARLEKKKRRRLPLSVWLAFLLVVTLTISTSIARYTSSVSGDAAARVAKFRMEVEPAAGQAETLTLRSEYDDESVQYAFFVTNSSEVAVRYSVIVSGVPAGVAVQLGDGTKLTSTGEEEVLTFSGTELNVNQRVTLSLYFYPPAQATLKDAPVTIQVEAVQVD